MKLACGGPLQALARVQRDSNERVTKMREHAGGRSRMLVIAVMSVLAIIATMFALIISSPLYRTLARALDSWAEIPTREGRARY